MTIEISEAGNLPIITFTSYGMKGYDCNSQKYVYEETLTEKIYSKNCALSMIVELEKTINFLNDFIETKEK